MKAGAGRGGPAPSCPASIPATADGPRAPLLPKSFKHRFPFRLAVPSFIYPDDYAPNVRRLAPFVDQIELLFFEGRRPPSRRLIRELAALAREHDAGYNVHLPSDVSIGHANPRRRRHALKTLLLFIDRVAPLEPATLTLHVPCEAPGESPEARRPWTDAVQGGLGALTAAIAEPARLSIETLDYPLEWLQDVVADLGLSICMDVGHLLLGGQDPGLFFDRLCPRISIIHLHAVNGGRDHQPLTRLAPPADEAVRRVLARFRGIVSLEVFSFDALNASLGWLEAHAPIKKNEFPSPA
jgi:sugar phosphate isomerase/epimerase